MVVGVRGGWGRGRRGREEEAVVPPMIRQWKKVVEKNKNVNLFAGMKSHG
jgi:hypothetical protein